MFCWLQFFIVSVHSCGVSHYGMAKAKVYYKSYTEKDVQEAIDYLHSAPKKDLVYAANHFGVKYSTLCNCWLGLSHPAHKYWTAWQYLTDTEEDTFCKWIAHQSSISKPLHQKTLMHRVHKFVGIPPSKQWYWDSLVNTQICIWANLQAFIPKGPSVSTIPNHCRQLGQVLDEWDIPIKNIYNMNEKGCQWTGGRHLCAIKCFIPWSQHPHYKLQSSNLELVAIIDCVCVDGTSLHPGFIFAGEKFHPEWFLDEEFPDIRYMFSIQAMHVGSWLSYGLF